MACTPWWVNKPSCPYGTLLPGDVTLPKDVDFVTVVAVVYSYIPFAVSFLFAFRFLWKRGTQDLFFLLFTGVLVLVNEAVIKNIVAENRPGQVLMPGSMAPRFGTCALSCGMPSSHASISVAYYLLILYEYYSFIGTTVTPQRFVVFFLCWTVVLLPIPLSREILHDHSTRQVAFGGLLGFSLAVIWTLCMGRLQKRWEHKFGETIDIRGITVLRHSLPPPLATFDERQPLAYKERVTDDVEEG